MSDIVLAGQQQYAQKFFMPSVKAGNFSDDFLPAIPHSALPGTWRKNRLTPVGSAAANAINQFQIPARNLLGDTILEISLGATGGGNYCTMPCASLPTNVRVSHGGNELHNYAYRPVWQYLQTLWLNEEKSRWQTAAGGTGGSGAAVIGYTPIPTFWTSFKHDKNEFPVPLPINASSQYVLFEITLDSIANILASGGSGGSLTSATLVYWEFIVAADEAANIIKGTTGPDWNRYGYDWQPVPATTVATGTSAPTTLDLSGFQGDIKEILWYGITATNTDTNHSYYTCQNLVYTDLQVDAVSIYTAVQGTANELIADQLIFNQAKYGADATFGAPYVVNFSRRRDAHAWDGSLNSNIFKKLTLNVEHSAGSNVYVTVCATMNRYYIFRNGLFERIK